MNDAESNRQKEILRVLEDLVGEETTTSDETSLEELDTEGTCTCGASSHADQVSNIHAYSRLKIGKNVQFIGKPQQ